jgi:hypothetical protein
MPGAVADSGPLSYQVDRDTGTRRSFQEAHGAAE